MGKILVLGGAFQGKGDFVQQKYKIKKQEMICSLSMLIDSIENKRYPIVINGFHAIIGEAVRKQIDISFLVVWLQEEHGGFREGSWIIISDEIGCGVVPVSKEERQIREETGRLLCKISAQADQVFRIMCGIPIQIK